MSTFDAINLDSNTVTLASAATPLPISLLRFSAMKTGGGITVSWTTATEHDCKSFVVERSKDARNGSWGSIGALPAAGSSSGRDYKLLDRNPATGVNYYRLRTTNVNGTYILSNVASVRVDSQLPGVNVFPSPVGSRCTVSGTLPGSLISLIDMTGRPLKQIVAAGIDKVEIGRLQAGTYMLRAVNMAGTTTTINLIKQ